MDITQLGWNLMTFNLSGILLFSLIGTWGLIQQHKAISINKSGKSISIDWIIYFTFFHVNGFIYGVSLDSLALEWNAGLRLTFHIPILIVLFKYESFNRRHWTMFAIMLLVNIAMIFLPHKHLFFLTISAGAFIALALQPWKIWKNKDRGVVSIRLMITYVLSTMFWVLYSWLIDDWALKINTHIMLSIFTLTVILWYKYPPQEESITVSL